MSRGLQRERDLVKRLRSEGYWALRSPASLGTVDVVALKLIPRDDERLPYVHHVRFVECKSTSAGPFHSFGPKEREALSQEAKRFGARAELCWWPPDGKGPRFLSEDEWPRAKQTPA